MLLTAGTWDNTIRWIPPLVVTKDQIDDALSVFESSMEAATK
jgi:4-aminobutyrate aminotransferase